MEITDVSAVGVELPVRALEDGGNAPYVHSAGQYERWTQMLVRVETDAGVTGWGEMRPFLTPEVTRTVLEDGIAPWVVGRSPFEVESLRRQMYIEYIDTDMFFAPIDVACWDIIGKQLGMPVYELLGGWTAQPSTDRRTEPLPAGELDPDPVEAAFALGILPPEESREHAARIEEAGFRILKTKAGRDWKEDVARIKAMHDEVDGALEFRLDPNGGWSPDEAVRVSAELADAGIYLQYLEQPIRVDSHDSLARLRERTRQPIAPNEDTYDTHNLRRMIEQAALDVAVVDMVPAGGISGLRTLAAIAEDAGIPLVHHGGDFGVKTAAILHAVSGIPGFTLPPDIMNHLLADDILAERLAFADGQFQVPSAPGLGVEVDLDKVEEYRVTPLR